MAVSQAAVLSVPDASEVALFSARRPKHALAGAQSAFKNVIKGASAGGFCLVAAPVLGAKAEGVLGMGAGFVVGAGAAAALSAAGLYTGARQLYSGIRNTPQALRESDRDWNPYYRRWERHDLAAAAQVVSLNDDQWIEEWQAGQDWVVLDPEGDQIGTERSTAFDEAGPAVDGTAHVVDTGYYDLLGVHPSSSAQRIRHSYFKLARQCHPDRNVSADSCARFQALGEAYQVECLLAVSFRS